MRNLPSTRCLRLVWGVEHSLISAGASTSTLPAARLGPCEPFSADPGVAPPEGHPGHGRLQVTARAVVRQWGGGLGRLLAPSGAGGARWIPAAPRRAGACTSRPELASFPAPGAVTGAEPSAGRALLHGRHGAAGGAGAGAALLRAGGGPGRPAAAPLRRGWVGRGSAAEGPGRGRSWKAGEPGEGRPGEGGPAGGRCQPGGGEGEAGCGVPACGSFLSSWHCFPHITCCRSIPCRSWLRPHVTARSVNMALFRYGGLVYTEFIFSCPGRPAGEVRWAEPWHALQTPRLGAVLCSALLCWQQTHALPGLILSGRAQVSAPKWCPTRILIPCYSHLPRNKHAAVSRRLSCLLSPPLWKFYGFGGSPLVFDSWNKTPWSTVVWCLLTHRVSMWPWEKSVYICPYFTTTAPDTRVPLWSALKLTERNYSYFTWNLKADSLTYFVHLIQHIPILLSSFIHAVLCNSGWEHVSLESSKEGWHTALWWETQTLHTWCFLPFFLNIFLVIFYSSFQPGKFWKNN